MQTGQHKHLPVENAAPKPLDPLSQPGGRRHGHTHAHGGSKHHEHVHEHPHEHGHAHGRGDGHDHHLEGTPHTHHPSELHPGNGSGGQATRLIRLEQELLSRNSRLAERNRGWLAGRKAVAINLMGSAGSGKTSLLERTIRDLGSELSFYVIEGDQATTRDAERIRAAGGRSVQINTGAICHLDATMVEAALQELDPPGGAVVLVENVGNLVCPALFDLGENARVVVSTVTDGDDKPIKYPHMFHAADLVLLNKADLLDYVLFEDEAFTNRVRQVNADVKVLKVSAKTGEGMDEWYNWLRKLRLTEA